MTSRLDNMTADERLEALKPNRKNYIIEQCCSVDDLRCHLQNHTAKNADDREALLEDLETAIAHERLNRKRITIINMLARKATQIEKLSFVFILIGLSSCGNHQVIILDEKDMVFFSFTGLLLLFFFVVWVIAYVDERMKEARRRKAGR